METKTAISTMERIPRTAASYLLHESNVEDFLKRVEKLNRRIETQGFDVNKIKVTRPGKFTVEERKIGTFHGYRKEVHRFEWITVVGDPPCFQDWEFLARYDHDDVAALANSVPGVSLPREYWEIQSNHCDHCLKRIRRKKTFLVRNRQSGEYKVVGSNCLKDFLGHDDPGRLASVAMWYWEAIRSLGSGELRESGPDYDPVHYIREDLAIANAIVRLFGWCSLANEFPEGGRVATMSRLRFVTGPAPDDGDARAEYRRVRKVTAPTDEDWEATDWILNHLAGVEADNEWLYKLKVITRDADGVVSFRNRGLLCSAVTLWIRHQKALEQERVGSEAPPVENGRYIIRGKIVKIQDRHTNYGVVTKMTLKDEQNRRYWGSLPSGATVGEGDEIAVRATVQVSRDKPWFGFFKRPILVA